MGKFKVSKPTSVPNKHLHSRISYLYQAATYLSSVQQTGRQKVDPAKELSSTGQSSTHIAPQAHAGLDCAAAVKSSQFQDASIDTNRTGNIPFSRLLLSHLRDVSLKGQVRLSPEMKRTICRRCYSLLVPGQSSTTRIENPSRGEKKPWADMLVIRCNACGAEKRFPVGMTRQPSRDRRATKCSAESTGGS